MAADLKLFMVGTRQDMEGSPDIAKIIKSQGADFDALVIEEQEESVVYELSRNGDTAYSTYKLQKPLGDVYKYMCEKLRHAHRYNLPSAINNLLNTLIKFDTQKQMVFFNSKEIDLVGLIDTT